MRALIDIKQIDVSKLNDVKIYDELPLEVEGQVAYCQGKLYYGDGSEWKEINVGGSALPEGTINQTLRHNGTEWVSTDRVKVGVSSYDPTWKEVFMQANEFGIWNSNPIVRSLTLFVIDGETANTGLSLGLDQNTSQSIVNLDINRQGDGSELSKLELVSYDAATSPYASQHTLRVSYSQENSCYELETFGNTPSSICKFSAKTIQSDYLSGTGSALLEATADGTIQRSTTTIPAAQVNSDWNATEGVAQILNKPEIPQGESVNIETLTADKTLTASDATVQIYTSDEDRRITLPTTGLVLGQKFVFINNNPYSSRKLYQIVQGIAHKNNVYSQSQCTVYWDGVNWSLMFDNDNTTLGANANGCKYGIAIGNGANGENGIGIGRQASGYNGVALGSYSTSSYDGVCVGREALSPPYGVSIGSQSGYTVGNYTVCIGHKAGKSMLIANRLYIHSSNESVGANSLIYGEFDNRIVRINNTLYVNDLVGTGDRPVVADSNGKLKVGTSTLPSRIEYLSGNLSGTEHIFTGTTLGITGDLRSRIKNIKCFGVESSGNYNGALIANEFIYETDVTVNTTVDLRGSFKIILFIEYV